MLRKGLYAARTKNSCSFCSLPCRQPQKFKAICISQWTKIICPRMHLSQSTPRPTERVESSPDSSNTCAPNKPNQRNEPDKQSSLVRSSDAVASRKDRSRPACESGHGAIIADGQASKPVEGSEEGDRDPAIFRILFCPLCIGAKVAGAQDHRSSRHRRQQPSPGADPGRGDCGNQSPDDQRVALRPAPVSARRHAGESGSRSAARRARDSLTQRKTPPPCAGSPAHSASSSCGNRCERCGAGLMRTTFGGAMPGCSTPSTRVDSL